MCFIFLNGCLIYRIKYEIVIPRSSACPTRNGGVTYLVNQLELDCHEAQDQGYEFHFSWLLILIAFIAWEMPEGVTFLDIEPFDLLAAKFTTLWYSSDMNKQWKSNTAFHTYYLHLKRAIKVEPHMTLSTLQRF
jgi:hypothetical protein